MTELLQIQIAIAKEKQAKGEKTGRPRDAVAAVTGVSGRHVENLAVADRQIKAAEQAGDTATALAMRETLNAHGPRRVIEGAASTAIKSTGSDLRDFAGNLVPESLRVVFEVAHGLDALTREIGQSKSKLKPLLAKTTSLQREINLHDAEHGLTSTQAYLRMNRPHAVCPACKGVSSKDCQSCGGDGWVDKGTYEVVVKGF